MRTMIVGVIATLAFTTGVFAAPMPDDAVCEGSSSTITTHGVWDCR